jgi:hypothetical protein
MAKACCHMTVIFVAAADRPIGRRLGIDRKEIVARPMPRNANGPVETRWRLPVTENAGRNG